jgi:hypothetical protein
MGNRSGRICFLHQIDFETDTLNYNSATKSDTITGTIQSESDLTEAISNLLKLHATSKIEIALKQIRYKNLYGVCIKSFPRTLLTNSLLNLIMLCTGGFNGTELTHLPFKGTILEQPNIFIEAYNIYTDEHNKYVQEKRKDDKK